MPEQNYRIILVRLLFILNEGFAVRMPADARARITEKLDEIWSELGLDELETFQAKLSTAFLFLTNLTNLVTKMAASADPDHGLKYLLDASSEQDLEQHLLFLNAIQSDVVPIIKKVLNTLNEAVTTSPPGRPRFAKDRQAKQAVCAYIHDLVGRGRSEVAAKKLAVAHFSKDRPKPVSYTTISRIWKQRAELLTGVDARELFAQVFTALATSRSVEWQESETPEHQNQIDH